MDLIVPLGSTLWIALFCTATTRFSAISTPTYCSYTLLMLPSSPPVVSTSPPPCTPRIKQKVLILTRSRWRALTPRPHPVEVRHEIRKRAGFDRRADLAHQL